MGKEIEGLIAEFGRSEQIKFACTPLGMDVVEVQSPFGYLQIALQGAQVLDWTPTGERPVLWSSPQAKFTPGKAYRGGIPVCWPWFGAHAIDHQLPSHGFARNQLWQVRQTKILPTGEVNLILTLPESAQSRNLWNHSFHLELSLRLGTTLDLLLTTQNSDTEPLKLTQALHTYFNVSDVSQIKVSGFDELEYFDQLSGQQHRQVGDIDFKGEVDRIYFDRGGSVRIIDPGYQREIQITKKNSRTSVVWNPWIEKSHRLGDMGPEGYRTMVCVESANVSSDEVLLQPSESHGLAVSYRCLR